MFDSSWSIITYIHMFNTHTYHTSYTHRNDHTDTRKYTHTIYITCLQMGRHKPIYCADPERNNNVWIMSLIVGRGCGGGTRGEWFHRIYLKMKVNSRSYSNDSSPAESHGPPISKPFGTLKFDFKRWRGDFYFIITDVIFSLQRFVKLACR